MVTYMLYNVSHPSAVVDGASAMFGIKMCFLLKFVLKRSSSSCKTSTLPKGKAFQLAVVEVHRYLRSFLGE